MPTATPLSLAHASLADAVLPSVLAAARIQMGYFRSGTAVITKADTTPVTAADRLSEAVILAALAQIAPSVPVIAEEAMAAGVMPQLGPEPDAEFFLVDPLDGTREFINGRPEFTINIALVRGGVPRFGLIYAPASGILTATLGDDHCVEAYVAPDAAVTRLAELTLNAIHTRTAPAAGLVAVASLSHNSPGTDAFLAQYTIIRRIAAGSSLKFCLVAKGNADIYPRVGPTCEWDVAAGHAILRAAGGTVTRLDGARFGYGNQAGRFRNPDFVAWGRSPLPPQH